MVEQIKVPTRSERSRSKRTRGWALRAIELRYSENTVYTLSNIG